MHISAVPIKDSFFRILVTKIVQKHVSTPGNAADIATRCPIMAHREPLFCYIDRGRFSPSLGPLRKFVAVLICRRGRLRFRERPIGFFGTPTPAHDPQRHSDSVGRPELEISFVLIFQGPKTRPTGEVWTLLNEMTSL